MSQLKITEMPTASSANLSDYVPIVQEGINKKVSVEALVGDEADRIEAEKKRVQAEADRVAAEKSRVQFEEQRKRDENTRVSNENERTLKEEERISNENSRQSNEEDRVSSESARVSNENTRIENENARIEAENARKNANIRGLLEQGGSTYSGAASDSGVKLHKVVGKTEQGTTKGYQLFDASKLPTKSLGGATVTNNGDGSFTISGSGSLTTAFYNEYIYTHEETLKLLKAGTLYADFGAITRPIFFVQLKQGDENYILTLNNSDKQNSSAVITEEMLFNPNTQLRLSIYASFGTITPATVKPMLYQDGDGTWEPFTGGKPAPNPDYPMPIENVELSKIESRGRNIFNSNLIKKTTQYGITIECDDDGTITLNGTATANVLMYYDIETIKAGTYVTLSLNNPVATEKNIHNIVCLQPIVSINGSVCLTPMSNVNSVTTEKIVADVNRICIRVNNGYTMNNYKLRPMLEIGEQAHDFEKYKHATVETSLTLAEGDTYENKQITRVRKQIAFDGSSDEVWVQSNSAIGYRYSIALTPRAIISDATNGQTSFNTRLPLGLKGATYTNKNCYTIANDGNLWVSLNGTETLEEFKRYLQAHPMTLEYTLATPTTEEFKVLTIPSYYPFTNVSADNDLETDMWWKILADSDRSLEVEALEKRIAALEKQLIGG